MAVSSNGAGTMTVVKETAIGKFEVAETVPTQPGARTITIDEQTHHIYLSAADYGPRSEPTPENPKPRAPVLPGTFMVMEYGY